ncbi:MAG: histidine kinase, partial [Flavobacterium sp.]
ATKYIRNVMKSQIPIIALTADVTTVDLSKCKVVGMNDYIAKPVDERLLYSKIVGLLKKPVVIFEQNVIGNAEIEKIKHIDMSYLIKLTKANPILMKEMIAIYLKQTPPLIMAMKQSILDKDWNLLQEIIHKIIPSFTIMGFNPNVQELAKKIQEFTYTIEISEEIHLLAQELEDSCNHAFKELEFEFNNIKN